MCVKIFNYPNIGRGVEAGEKKEREEWKAEIYSRLTSQLPLKKEDMDSAVMHSQTPRSRRSPSGVFPRQKTFIQHPQGPLCQLLF